MKKKSQLKIMESSIIILIVFFVLAIASIFFFGLHVNSVKNKMIEFENIEVIRKTQVLNFFPEIQCTKTNDMEGNCYDFYKIIAFKEQIEKNPMYYKPLLGHLSISFRRYEPSPEISGWILPDIELYDNPKPSYKKLRKVRYPVSIRDVTEENKDYFGVMILGVYE
ncbi:MAG: hypothetical protein KKF44_03885 [Nanoarchaeota archaeon]|nr:hypothetical protein [Nanoarchaeota archaeon]